jgi:hypothetical protein
MSKRVGQGRNQGIEGQKELGRAGNRAERRAKRVGQGRNQDREKGKKSRTGQREGQK